jgi:protein gp37
MGYKTKIDWCDSSWNPVTGCLHGCEDCYARRIANRFGGSIRLDLPPDTSWRANRDDSEELKKLLMGDFACHSNGGLHILDEPALNVPVYPAPPSEIEKRSAPYPYYFDPTFHRYKLDQPQKWSEPRTIFVCSMADLFGKWVPDEWIEAVINACLAAPQHRYLFLTKNPARYMHLIANGIIPENQPNFWFGSTATISEMEFFWCDEVNTFVSIEPILAPFEDLTDEGVDPASKTNWIIVGAETGNRKNKVVPQKSWIDEIVSAAKKAGTPVFMKESLREIMGDDFKQEFPWEVNGCEH